MDNKGEKNLTIIYKRLFKLFLINELNKTKINLNDSDIYSTKSNSNLNYFNANSVSVSNIGNDIRNSYNLSAFEELNNQREFEVNENELFSNMENLNGNGFGNVNVNSNFGFGINFGFNFNGNFENNICPFGDVVKNSLTNCQAQTQAQSQTTSNANNFNYSNYYNGNFYNPNNPFKSITKSCSSQDDIYSLDFQGRYFIEKYIKNLT